jgi:Tfp pilus assembly protein PilX
MLIRRLTDPRGSALVPALVIMGLMLTFGLALLVLAEGNQRDSRRERERESSFQLAEGVLNAQIYRLSTRWPSAMSDPGMYPAECNVTSTQDGCPDGAALQANFSGPDFDTAVSWKVQVRDNNSATKNYYTEGIMAPGSTVPARDANGDNFIWTRAEATVAGRKRVLVALVEAENTTINFPRAAVVAGKFATTNKGNKVIIDTNGGGNQFTPGDVIVRCDLASSGCATYEQGKGQVEPDTVKSNVNQPNALSPEALETLRQRAIAEGNYTADGQPCPTSLQGDKPGEIVFIENSIGCNYQGNAVWNSPAKPGFLVIAKGAISLRGTTNFYGVIYHANVDNSPGTLVDLNGNTQVYGAITIDGPGGLMAGSSKENVVYDPNVIAGLTAFGTASIVQNTFREIKGTN